MPASTVPASAALRSPLLPPGSVPSWRVAAVRAIAVAAAVVAFGAVAQWPMVGARSWLFAGSSRNARAAPVTISVFNNKLASASRSCRHAAIWATFKSATALNSLSAACSKVRRCC